jgi:DNA-directed RNA polymerase subunit RPC12/RpoP
VTESLVDLGLAVICETCESEIDLDTDPTMGVCRQCGLAFLIEPEPTARSVAS